MTTPPESVSTEDLLAQAGFLRRLSGRLVANCDDAEDLTQDALVVALERRPARSGSLAAWFARVARNLVVSTNRSNATRSDRERFAASVEGREETTGSLERLEIQRVLLEELMRLPDERREVLYLRYYQGLSPKSIASRLGIPLKTVHSRHARALGVLRERLDARSLGDRRHWLELLVPVGVSRSSETRPAWIRPRAEDLGTRIALAGGIVLLAVFGWRGDPVRARVAVASGDSARASSRASAAAQPDGELAPAWSGSSRTSASIAEEPKLGNIELHLTWSTGEPAADVGIDVCCDEDPAPRRETTRVRTDEKGVARLNALYAGRAWIQPDLREGFGVEVTPDVTAHVSHALAERITVRGRVFDPAGEPARNASIWSRGPSTDSPDTQLATRCGADGTFELRDVEAYGTFGARAVGHRPSTSMRVSAMPSISPGVRAIELRLQSRGGRIAGRVLTPDGRPVPRARILAGWTDAADSPAPDHQPEAISPWLSRIRPEPATNEAREDGTFSLIDDFDPGYVWIAATARGYPIQVSRVFVAEGRTTYVEIALQEPVRLTGVLLDLEGRPLQGVPVSSSHATFRGRTWTPFPAPSSVSDGDGRFTLEWLPSGPNEIQAADPGRPEIGRAFGRVDCRPDGTTDVDLRMERGNVISGRVTDERGSPLSGWRVRAEATDTLLAYAQEARVQTDGSFALLNLGAAPCRLTVRADDLGAARLTLDSIPVGTSELAIAVANAHERGGALRGRLVDLARGDHAGVGLWIWNASEDSAQRIEFDATTGRFEVERPAGRYRLVAERDRRTCLLTEWIEIRPESLLELGELGLRSPGLVEIRLPRTNEASEDPVLQLCRAGMRWPIPMVRRDDAWVADGLMPGPWRITTAGRECVRGAEIDVPEGGVLCLALPLAASEEVELVFERGGAADLEIEARDRSGRLVRFAEVPEAAWDRTVSARLHLPRERIHLALISAGGVIAGETELDLGAERGAPGPVRLDFR